MDRDNRLKRILSLADIRRVMLEKELHNLVIAKDIAVEEVLTLTLEDDLNTALKKMPAAEIRELPVVSREDSRKVISMLSRKDIIRTYHEQIERIEKGRPDDLSGIS